MFSSIAKNWKFSKAEIEQISWLIRHHLHPQKFFELKKLKANRLMLSKYFEMLLDITVADGKGKKPSYKLNKRDILRKHRAFKTRYSKTKFYTGHDIMYLYPELTGQAIGRKQKELNTQILAKL